MSSSGHASSFIPALRYGNKIFPEDIAGAVGQPVVNNMFYVDPVNGSATNGGRSWDDAVTTLTLLDGLITTNQYDVGVIAPGGTGSGTATPVGSALTISSSLYSIIGAAAPSINSPRARILVNTTSESLTLSGNGNRFENIQLACFVDVNVPFTLSGDRNYFGGAHIAGMGIAAAGGDTAGRSLVMSGADENVFDTCEIGFTTIDRTVANTELELASTCSRNKFLNTYFAKSAATLQTSVFVKTTSNGIGSYNFMDNCVFDCEVANNSFKLDAVFDLSSQATSGNILLRDCISIGCDDWEGTPSNRLWFMPYTATTNAIGLAVNQT